MTWIALILFLFSLLAVCKPPFYQAWLLSVAIAGLPWLFAVISLAVFVEAALRGRGAGAPGTAFFSGAAFVLFCMPVFRAWRMRRTLETGLHKAFGKGAVFGTRLPAEYHISGGGDPGVPAAFDAKLPPAFCFGKMFSGPLAKKIPFQTLCYDDAPGCPLHLDLYPSALEGNRPCVIVIHGGSWTGGHSRQLPELNSRLARAGYHVAAVNYRLAPLYQSPLAVEDVRKALTFLRAGAADLRIAADRFVLLGRSAGGQIALQAAYTLHDCGIRGVIAYYAPTDLAWGYAAPASRFIMDSCKVLEAYLGGSYADVPLKYHAASPVETPAAGRVPTLLLHGKNDVLVAYEHSVRLAAKLREADAPHCLVSFASGTHGFDYVLDGPEGQLATYAVSWFLRMLSENADKNGC